MELTRKTLEEESDFVIRAKKHEPRKFAAKPQHFKHEPDRSTLKGHFEGKSRFYDPESSAIAARLPQYQEYKNDHIFVIPLEEEKHMEISAHISHLISQGDLMPDAEMKERYIELELSAYGVVMEKDISVLEVPWRDVFGGDDITDLTPDEIKASLVDLVLTHAYFFENSFEQTRNMAKDFDYI